MKRTKETCKDINSHIPCRSHTEELYVMELIREMDGKGMLYWSVDAWRASDDASERGLIRLLREGLLRAVTTDDDDHEGVLLTVQKERRK